MPWSIQPGILPRAALSLLVSPTPQVTRFCSTITCPELEAENVFPSVKSEHQMASLVAFLGFRASAYRISLTLVSHTRQMGPL